jgi:hypothetical protein
MHFTVVPSSTIGTGSEIQCDTYDRVSNFSLKFPHEGTTLKNRTSIDLLKGSAAPFALGIALVFASTAASAQTTGAESAQSQDEAVAAQAGQATDGAQEIVVTGSRIQSPAITSVSPVQVVSDVAIDQAGVSNIQDLLLENPVFGTPTLARTNSAFLTSGTGVATVDLRNLGTDRTLVLINGRRVVAGLLVQRRLI